MASVTDKIVSAAPVWTGQLASSIPDGTTTSFSLTSSSGLTDGEVYYFTIDRVDASGNKTLAKKEVIKGKLNGTNVVDCIRGVEGSAQAHSSGATVEILWTAAQWNDLKSHITTEHGTDGTHDTTKVVTISDNQTITGVKTFSATPKTDAIAEKTTDAGVTVDGLLIKDGAPTNWNGWIPANETWTYASSTSFTVSGNVTTKYPKGTKIKLTQSGLVKYFYVIATSYSSPNTTVAITGGSDYSLANETITDNYYSYMETPVGFPAWFNYTPTYSASGSMTWTSVTTNLARFVVKGSTCTVWIDAIGTTGGTASDQLRATLPVNVNAPSWTVRTGASVKDTSSSSPSLGGFAFVTDNPNTIAVVKYDASNFGIGSGRQMSVTFTYPI